MVIILKSTKNKKIKYKYNKIHLFSKKGRFSGKKEGNQGNNIKKNNKKIK